MLFCLFNLPVCFVLVFAMPVPCCLRQSSHREQLELRELRTLGGCYYIPIKRKMVINRVGFTMVVHNSTMAFPDLQLMFLGYCKVHHIVLH